MVVCEFCNKEFSTVGCLKTHQKKTKTCLEIRGEKIEEVYKCEYCESIFNRKDGWKIHVLNCKHKSRIEENMLVQKLQESETKNKQLETEIILLKEILEKAISKPTTQNNTITQNNVNITPMYTLEQYAEIAREKFTIQDFNKGAKGVSNFIGETIPEEMLSFSDPFL